MIVHLIDDALANPRLRQLKSLEEIVNSTDAKVYLLDEWDANLDADNKAKADALVGQLAARARVIEISHGDRAEG